MHTRDMSRSNTTTGRKAGKEATMAAYTPPKVGTARWLSANGHPGYSQATARKVAELQARFPGLSFHAAIYGGRELALRIEAAR